MAQPISADNFLQTIKVVSTTKVTYTGTAGNTGAITLGTLASPGDRITVRVWSDQDCWVAFGTSAVATANDMPMTAKLPEFFDVTPGDRVSAIQQSTGGTLYVTTVIV